MECVKKSTHKTGPLKCFTGGVLVSWVLGKSGIQVNQCAYFQTAIDLVFAKIIVYANIRVLAGFNVLSKRSFQFFYISFFFGLFVSEDTLRKFTYSSL